MQKFCCRIIILFWVCAATTHAQAGSKKLKVEVLYESLCPDSHRFMSKQLARFYGGLQNFIDIELVPFGKSHSEKNGARFHCQHGPAECEGNRQQSCVLQQTQDQPTQVKFAICQMEELSENSKSVDYCAKSAGLSSNIEQCMKTDLGTRLQLRAEQITNKYKPKFVPTIVYDNQFDQAYQDQSIRDFRGAVCGQLFKRGYITKHTPNSPCH